MYYDIINSLVLNIYNIILVVSDCVHTWFIFVDKKVKSQFVAKKDLTIR